MPLGKYPDFDACVDAMEADGKSGDSARKICGRIQQIIEGNDTSLPADPPKEFRLFRRGVNRSTKGPVVYDDVSEAMVMSRFRDEGHLLSIDLDHRSLDFAGDPDRERAYGHFSLESRPDGLWAVDIDWSPRGFEMLSQKEYRYMSPAFYAQATDGSFDRVVRIVNCAVTNHPASKGLRPLVMNKSCSCMLAKEDKMELKRFAEVSEDALMGMRSTLEGLVAALEDAEGAPEDKLAAASEAAKGLLELLDSLSMAEPAEEELADDEGEEEEEELTKLLSAFTVTDDRRAQRAADKLINILRKGQDALEELDAAKKRAADLETEAMIAKLESLGKLVPAQRAWAKTLGSAGLEAYAESAPIIIALGKTTIEPKHDADASAETLDVDAILSQFSELYLKQNKIDTPEKRASFARNYVDGTKKRSIKDL